MTTKSSGNTASQVLLTGADNKLSNGNNFASKGTHIHRHLNFDIPLRVRSFVHKINSGCLFSLHNFREAQLEFLITLKTIQNLVTFLFTDLPSFTG